jgi:glyoxylase-like metal-dependent hydrolase (beta-lactamase superfamily II)
VLDEGAAFTGDLTRPMMAGDDNVDDITRSWAQIRALGVRMVYPGHGPARPLEQVLG